MPSFSPRNGRIRQRAFTLTELLVAIGAVIILAGLLFSVVNIATAKRNDLRCLGNLRDHFVVAQLFATDHQGKFPSNNMRTELYPYLGIIRLQNRQGTPMTCPATQRIAPTNHYMHATYSINQFLTSAYDGEVVSWQKIRFFQAVENPSRRFLFLDGAHSGGTNGDYNYYALVRPDKGTWVFPHENGQHVVFVDGHAERLSREEFLKPENTNLTKYANDNPWSAR